ncbi:hypothetical protein TNCV_2350601 [Trichonephila clavipes]|uniref:Uncharacterized protein n=1 Tax=Trichonephila clavipes TaxID=2585209 RepID=A0A8X6VFB0_TRICX|nr:hypothetical protein TNCV_2350601 [Trichonephila clavipes]
MLDTDSLDCDNYCCHNYENNLKSFMNSHRVERLVDVKCDGQSPLVVVVCDETHFWLNGYVNEQNCRIWSEANPQVYVETPLHPEKLTVWCALWAGGILLQKR